VASRVGSALWGAGETGAPSAAFVYREIDPRRCSRAATLELILPPEADPEPLVELAAEAARRGPLLSGVGGFTASWNPYEKPTAFWEIHDWCKRFVGLDVQDADAMAWDAFDGLPGSGWLTLVGNVAADRLRLDLAALAAGPWQHGVKATTLPHGLLLQAGPAPVGRPQPRRIPGLPEGGRLATASWSPPLPGKLPRLQRHPGLVQAPGGAGGLAMSEAVPGPLAPAGTARPREPAGPLATVSEPALSISPRAAPGSSPRRRPGGAAAEWRRARPGRSYRWRSCRRPLPRRRRAAGATRGKEEPAGE
jgi:hypothetical protein